MNLKSEKEMFIFLLNLMVFVKVQRTEKKRFSDITLPSKELTFIRLFGKQKTTIFINLKSETLHKINGLKDPLQ